MSKLSESKGVILSDYPDIKLPCQNIWSFLNPIYEEYSNLTAYVCTKTSKTYTYKELKSLSLRFGKELEKYVSYNSSEAVAVIMPNNIEYPVVVLGAFAVGASVCLIRNDFTPDIALDMMSDVKPKVLVIDSTWVEKTKTILDRLPKDIKIFVVGPEKSYPVGESLNKVFSTNEEGNLARALKVDPEATAIVTFSSGTTGKPKAILVNHRSTVNQAIYTTYEAMYSIKRAKAGFQDVLLANLPYAHIFSLHYYIIAASSVGCKILVFDSDEHLSHLLEVVNIFKARVLTFRASTIDELIRFPDLKQNFGSVEVVTNVGMPLYPAAVEEFKKILGRNIFVQEFYGTSEIGAALTYPLNKERIGATGKPLPNIKAIVLDLNTEEPILEPFTRGELLFLSPGIMKGYLNNPEATKEAFKGPWYRTGDICYFDEDKFLYVIERFKDLITFKGKKVFPSSIESIVKQHEAVLDVGVIGVLDPKSGEEVPRAFVQSKGSVSEEEIIEFVNSKTSQEELRLLGGVRFVDAVPRNHLGKILRKILREIEWTS